MLKLLLYRSEVLAILSLTLRPVIDVRFGTNASTFFESIVKRGTPLAETLLYS